MFNLLNLIIIFLIKVFLKLAHALSHFDSKKCYYFKANNMNDYFLVVKPFENRINLIKASLDHVNLSGTDPAPFKLKTFIVTTKLPTLSLHDVKSLNFKKFHKATYFLIFVLNSWSEISLRLEMQKFFKYQRNAHA